MDNWAESISAGHAFSSSRLLNFPFCETSSTSEADVMIH
jgi:hypothetical protein